MAKCIFIRCRIFSNKIDSRNKKNVLCIYFKFSVEFIKRHYVIYVMLF